MLRDKVFVDMSARSGVCGAVLRLELEPTAVATRLLRALFGRRWLVLLDQILVRMFLA